MTKETLKIQIEDTRKYLNQSITEKQSADKILEISVKLDKLIEYKRIKQLFAKLNGEKN